MDNQEKNKNIKSNKHVTFKPDNEIKTVYIYERQLSCELEDESLNSRDDYSNQSFFESEDESSDSESDCSNYEQLSKKNVPIPVNQALNNFRNSRKQNNYVENNGLEFDLCNEEIIEYVNFETNNDVAAPADGQLLEDVKKNIEPNTQEGKIVQNLFNRLEKKGTFSEIFSKNDELNLEYLKEQIEKDKIANNNSNQQVISRSFGVSENSLIDEKKAIQVLKDRIFVKYLGERENNKIDYKNSDQDNCRKL